MFRYPIRIALGVAVLCLPAVAGAQDAGVVHLLSRATFGARAQDIARVEQLGIESWLDQQLRPERVDDSALEQRLERFESFALEPRELAQRYTPPQQRPEYRRALDSLRATGKEPTQEELRRLAQQVSGGMRAGPQVLLAELVSAKLTRAVSSERQLAEVMTDFWFNHFNVFFGDGPVRYLIVDYEQNAIRPHVFGKFRDLLEATAKHPAMLLYLDNAMSSAPDTSSPMMQRGRTRGLNENYARELMELHTLGVDAGYTQRDVVEVARAFTGWTVDRRAFAQSGRQGRNADESGFVFRPQLHDRGEKVVLGHKLKPGRGIEDGEQVLDILARDPSTAKFIATKLIERFVTDDPPADFVAELAAVFTKTDGDLRAVTRALFTSPKFYDERYRRAKVKTPFELVASALRVTNTEVVASRELMQTLRTLGQLPYTEPAPTGFPAASEDWVNSGALLNRMNFGIALAERIGASGASGRPGVRAPGRDGTLEADVMPILTQVLPGVDVTKRREQIVRDLQNSADTQSREQLLARALGFALGSPEFQRK